MNARDTQEYKDIEAANEVFHDKINKRKDKTANYTAAEQLRAVYQQQLQEALRNPDGVIALLAEYQWYTFCRDNDMECAEPVVTAPEDTLADVLSNIGADTTSEPEYPDAEKLD